MDYLQSLELQAAALQRKLRLLQDLRFFMDSASAEELARFGEELRAVPTAAGTSLGDALAAALGASSGASLGAYAPPPQAAPEARAAPRQEARLPTPQPPAPAERPREAPTETVSPHESGGPAAAAGGGRAREEALALAEASMVAIPASSFIMGSEAGDGEQPPHKVHLGAYRIGDHLVTNREYSLFVADNPQWSKDRADPELRDAHYLEDWGGGAYPEGKDEHPVAFVSFFAARAYAEWLGKRLPTEAEWECAARGGLVGKKYPNGDVMNDKLANLAKQYRGTTEVRKFEPNGFKLYDMAGNLFEWCADWYGPYPPGEARDPKGPDAGDYRVARGGSWMSGAGALRVSARVDMEETTCAQVGIRLADG